MIQKLMCAVALHKWTYTAAEYENVQAQRLSIPTKEATRTCKFCGEKQYEDRHCLGLNPPEYYSTWR